MSDVSETEAQELLSFLSPSARTDLKVIALQYFLGLTGTQEGRSFIRADNKYLHAIVQLTSDEQSVIVKDAYLALVNLSTDSVIAQQLLAEESGQQLTIHLLRHVLKSDSQHADIVCALLNNLSRAEPCAQAIVEVMTEPKSDVNFDQIIQAFCQKDYNPKANLHYLGPFLANLTQIRGARKYVLDKDRCVLQRLLPYTEYKESLIRRGGIVSILRNCCFELEYHDWLLSEQVDLLPRLLLPLAGPEEFSEEDMDRLPLELQYLEPDKERESDPDLRKLLVECIYQLCATQPCRNYIKDKNTYVILRALHMWEKDPAAQVAEEKLIHLLIKDEPEPGMENLREVVIPAAVEQQLTQSLEEEQRQIDAEDSKLRATETDRGGGQETESNRDRQRRRTVN